MVLNPKLDQKTTILFVIDDFMVGGVASFVKQYSQVLVKAGHQPIIIGCKYDLTDPENYFPGCKIIQVPFTNHYDWPFHLYRLVSWPIFFLSLIRCFQLNPTISLVHFSLSWSTFYAMLVPQTWFLKRVITFYGASHLEYLTIAEKRTQPIIKKIISWLKKCLQLLGFLWVNQIVVFSQYSQKLLIQEFGLEIASKINLIPGYITNIKSKLPKLNKAAQQINFLNYGRAENRKGLNILLAAGKKLAHQFSNFSITFVSPMDYLSYSGFFYSYEASDLFDKVKVLPKANRDQITSLLKKSDAFVMPSKDLETFGMTMIEAMAQGVTVIGTRVGAIPEITGKVDKRLIVSKPAPQALANKLLWFAKLSTNERKHLREKSLAVVKKYYSSEAVSPAILKLYGIKAIT